MTSSNKNSKKTLDPVPKPPLTPFQCYANESRYDVQKENPSYMKTQVNIELTRMWGRMLPEEQQPFVDMSGQDKNRYDLEIEDYKAGRWPPKKSRTEGSTRADAQIRVYVRKRPLNNKEKSAKEMDVISVPNSNDHVIVLESKQKIDLSPYLTEQKFRFDAVFDQSRDNKHIYNHTAKPLVLSVFEGQFATCFAYGQTGSGKTYTMSGLGNGRTDGIYAFATRDIFELMKTKYRELNLVVTCSFFEIYSGKAFDLLNNKLKLKVLEDKDQKVHVVNLKEFPVERDADVFKLINEGNQKRTSGATSANDNSSRSHAVFQINLRKKKSKILHGKLSLIDLAGNERGKDTSSTNRITRMEGAEINKSLLALKECIRALGRKNAHLPFRASKLTLILRDSFLTESAKTCMIATISPGSTCIENTLNTLRYADRVKELGVDSAVGVEEYESPSISPDPVVQPRQPTPKKTVTINTVTTRIDSAKKTTLNSNDLMLLKDSNTDEIDDNLHSYQVELDALQQAEEQLLDEHDDLIDVTEEWLEKSKLLIEKTDEVDYDQEAYARELNKLLDKQIDVMTRLRDKVVLYADDLQHEEQLSKSIKHPNIFITSAENPQKSK